MYALLIYNSWPEQESLSPQLERALLARHREVQSQASARNALAAVARLEPPRMAKTVHGPDETTPVTDGPYMESKEWLAGFYLVECEGEAEAISRGRRICPPQGRVEVRPVNWYR